MFADHVGTAEQCQEWTCADVCQAKDAFRQWHGEKWLAPSGLLEQPGTHMRAALLPFWLFEVSVRSEYSATVGVAADPCATLDSLTWTLQNIACCTLHPVCWE